MGDEDGVVDGIFLVRVGIGDDRRERGFAARTGSGGDGDQRGEFLHDAQDAFHLGDGLAGTGDACADALCAVHGRAAAESDDDVALVVVVELETLFDVGDGGVGDDLVIDGDVQPFRLEAVDDGLRHAEAHEPLVGDEQRALPALLFRKGGEFCEAALAAFSQRRGVLRGCPRRRSAPGRARAGRTWRRTSPFENICNTVCKVHSLLLALRKTVSL